MAPNQQQVEQQTFDVLRCLFEDVDRDVTCRYQSFGYDDLETDSRTSDADDTFDPELIADKLRTVADALNEDMKFKAALKDLQQAAAQEALDRTLTTGIDALVKSQVGQKAEVAPELQIIQASVAFGLYMKNNFPNMRSQLQSAIGNFLNQRVGSWVTQQGGWKQVASVSQP